MCREKTCVFLVAMLAVFTLAIITPTSAQAGGDIVTLWGKQKAGYGATNATQDGNTVEVKNTAEITKVTGTAKSYCIWKVGGYKGLLCGGEGRKSIIGKTLKAGKYIVRAGLSQGQSISKVSIVLKMK